ncbi:MAG: hypothetical protein ACYC4F_01505 [Armatimonadota bacterium]
MHSANCFEGLDDYSTTLIRHKTRRLVGQAGFTKSDKEDIELELALHLWQYLPQYDPAKGTHKTFVNFILDNKIRTMVAGQITAHYDVRMHDSSLDEVTIMGDGDSLCRGDLIDAEEYLMSIGGRSRSAFELVEMRVDIRRLVSRLSPEMQDLCEHLSLENIKDASLATGIPRYKIYELIRRLRFMFEQDGLAEYV